MGIADTAARLLRENGDAVTLSYTEAGSINPATGEGTPGSVVSYSGYGYPGGYAARDVDGTNIQAGDIRLTLQKIDAVPLVGWDAALNGETYRVMDVRRVRKAAADVIYVCQLRKQ